MESNYFVYMSYSCYRKEHKRHSPKCAFVKLNKEENQMKIEDFLKIECERQKARVVSDHWLNKKIPVNL